MTSPRPDTLNQSTLVQRLRMREMSVGDQVPIYAEAADTIEALQAENERLLGLLQTAVNAADAWQTRGDMTEIEAFEQWHPKARAAIGKVGGNG